jgi:hypothetical protein
VVFTTCDELAAAAPEFVDPPEEAEPLLPELPQAATARVAAAKAVVAHHRLRIAYLRSRRMMFPGGKPDLTDHIVWRTYLNTYGRP